MWKTSDEIKSQLTHTFQKLINDILAKSDGSRPLIFADEQEYQKIFSTPFSLEDNAWFVSDSKQFLIFLRQLSVVTNKEENIRDSKLLEIRDLIKAVGLHNEDEKALLDRWISAGEPGRNEQMPE